MHRKFILIAIGVALAIGLAAITGNISLGTAKTENAAAVETATVTRAPLRQSIECTGRVVSNLDVEIKCEASGRVIQLPYDVSDAVKQGDLVLEVDPVEAQRAVQQAEASLAASEARLAQAEADLAVAEKNEVAEKLRADAALKTARANYADAGAKAQRDQDLLAKKHVSVEEAETTRTAAARAAEDIRAAQAQVEAAQAMALQVEAKRQAIRLAKAQIASDRVGVDLAKERLSKTRVVAPIDGVISARTVQIGQVISSGISNVGGGTTALTISDLSRIFVLASVDESDVGEVRLDQRAIVTADAFPKERFEGQVVRIASKGVNTANVVTFEVKLEVTGENRSLLKPEMTANVEIVIAEKADALAVPLRALIRKGPQRLLVVRNESGDQETAVETGISDGVSTEIVSGVREGATVVLQADEAESRWRAQEQEDRNRRGGMMPPPPR